MANIFDYTNYKIAQGIRKGQEYGGYAKSIFEGAKNSNIGQKTTDFVDSLPGVAKAPVNAAIGIGKNFNQGLEVGVGRTFGQGSMAGVVGSALVGTVGGAAYGIGQGLNNAHRFKSEGDQIAGVATMGAIGAGIGVGVGAAAPHALGLAAGAIGSAGTAMAGAAPAIGSAALAASPFVAGAATMMAANVGEGVWNVGKKLVDWDETAEGLNKVKLSGLGKTVMGAGALFEGAKKGLNTYMDARIGTVMGTQTLTDRIPNYSPRDNAGADGDLVFAMHKNRRG